MSKIVVVGSISMDLVMETTRIAEQGETVFGERFSMVPGGKGANQAVALGRLQGENDCVIMLGNVGNDSFGPILLKNLEQNGILVDDVGTVPSSSGIAQITLFDGDNRIIYCPGANGQVSVSGWQQEWDWVRDADMVVLQNEIPHDANLAIARYCKEQGVTVLYNPAPARETDLEMLDLVDYITPNEHECHELFPHSSVEDSVAMYPNQLIVTLGTRGSVFHDGTSIQTIPALPTQAVDTTGAGDTFNAGLAHAIAKGLEVKEALQFATIASHLSVQKFGAQGGMPYLNAMKEHPKYEKNWYFE
ncbi:ribokinase [Streptococcus suis]|uniref:ribokinase n=1 Tax=Streptococcus suis TaxID=1307 RepID=UPI000C1A5878|nr:ribokinase [Streptococcus suis]